MKTKIFLSFLQSILYALLLGAGASLVFSVNPLTVALIFFAGKSIFWYYLPNGIRLTGSFMAGVNKEIWIDKLKENFYSQYEWLNGVEDWSEWVEFNTINFTIVGSDPVILKNNAVWPIVAAQRTDTNATVVLDTYDSTTTRIRNVEEIEAVIDKLESVVKQHRQKLMQEIVSECLWNYAPATAAAGAVSVTGANRAVVIGTQSTVAATMTIGDIAGLQQRWDILDFPQDGRVLVLSPYHREDLLRQDVTLQKQFANLKTGQALDLYGFKLYVASNTPTYVKVTLAKKAYAGAVDNVNDVVSSVAFVQSEVMKCMGDVEMFYKEKGINPEQRADEVGFQVRFKGVPQRTTNFYQQALISNRA